VASARGIHIPSLVIYKRFQSKDSFGDSTPPEAAFEMTESSYINVDVSKVGRTFAEEQCC
jgi:hypothetical protein